MIIKNNGTDLTDVHLAMVDSTWYMWLSVDPLADKNISNSPYMYCGGNPIMLIDPDGRDDYEFDADGNVNVLKNLDADNIYWINERGEREDAYLSFAYGTICSFTCDEETGNEWFEIQDSKSAEEILAFLTSNQSNVEWLHNTSIYEGNDNPTTLLISSRDQSTVQITALHAARNSVATAQSCWPIVDNHNHPKGTVAPGNSDKGRAAWLQSINPNVKMAIFTSQFGKSPFDKNGTLDKRVAR